MEPVYNISSDEDDYEPGQNKKLKPNEAMAEILFNADNEGDEPLNEPEVTVQTLNDSNKATDPLQFIEKHPDSQYDVPKITPVVQNCPIPNDGIVQKHTVPIKLRKIVNPSKELLKQMKHHNIKTFKDRDMAKQKSVQPVIIKYRTVSAVKSNNQSNTLQTKEAVQTKTIEDIKDLENCQSKGNDNKEVNNINEIKKVNLCVVEGCTGNVTYYFKAPIPVRKIKIWRFCLDNPNLKSGDLICDQHFIKEDILRIPMESRIAVEKEHAVPSLQKVLVGCCITQCINQNRNTSNMYPIPIWGHYTPWINLMGHRKLNIKKLHDLQQYRVCKRHFNETRIQKLASPDYTLPPTENLPSKAHYEGMLRNYLKNKELCFDKTSDQSETKKQQQTIETILKHGANECCTYLGCRMNKENSYIRFYKFPTDYDRAIKWLVACSRPDILLKARNEIQKYITESIGVCFQHKNDVEKKVRLSDIKENANKLMERKQLSVNGDSKMTEGDKFEGNQIDGSVENRTKENMYVPTWEYCAFVNCSTFIKDLVKKYRFPADNELLAQWIQAAGMPSMLSEDKIRTLFVCGKHFNFNQYTEMGTLILSSIPAPHTEFVDSSSHDGNEHWVKKTTITHKKQVERTADCNKQNPYTSFQNQASCSTSDIKTSKTVSVKDPVLEQECIVKHCSSNRTTNFLYSFPENRTRFIQWIKAVEKSFTIGTKLMSYKKERICDRHFETRYQIGSTRLRKNAIPTLNLVEGVPDVPDVPEAENDTSIVWKECNTDIFDMDKKDPNFPHIKGNAILRKDSIDFPNIRRQLKFGRHCPKLGYLQKYPYKLYRMTRNSRPGKEVEIIKPDGHRIQIHTAIIVDDDDEAEKEAIEAISSIIMENAASIPVRRTKSKSAAIKK